MSRNPHDSWGWVQWPKEGEPYFGYEGVYNTNEGGMFCYIVVPQLPYPQEGIVEKCFGAGNLYLLENEVIVGDNSSFFERDIGSVFPTREELWDSKRRRYRIEDHLSMPLWAAVLVGSSGGSWLLSDEVEDKHYHCDHTEYWSLEHRYLTDEGKELLRKLTDLYLVSDPRFVTFLDT